MTESNIFISKATQRNWDKLKNDGTERLKHRANKSRSQKIVTPEGYVMAGSLPRFVEELRDTTYPIDDLIYTLCALYIEHNRVSEVNKSRFFEEYTQYQRLSVSVPRQILKNRQDDWIGFVYQSLTTEGRRILKGLYYTKPVDDCQGQPDGEIQRGNDISPNLSDGLPAACGIGLGRHEI